MSLRHYKCAKCRDSVFLFPEDFAIRADFDGCGNLDTEAHFWEELPPNPVTVHSTETYMSVPQIDSIKTVYELDRQLNIEAQQDRELLALGEARRNS